MNDSTPSHYVVRREAGPAWEPESPLGDQPALDRHAAFMDALADEGFLVFGGPLPRSDAGPFRAMLIAQAHDEAEIHRRLADDPWTAADQLVTVSVEPWTIIVGTGPAAGTVGRRA